MYWLGLIHLSIDSFLRDFKFQKISNLVLLFHFLFLFSFWDWHLLALVAAPFFTKWIGAGDLKLATVLYLYSKALHLSTNYWIPISTLIGALTAVILRKKSIPFAPALIIGLTFGDYLAREGLSI